MLNKIFLQGRLVADPEMRHTPSGVAVASLRLAVDRDFKDKETGEKKADFINVVAWRSTAEFVSRYFTKGRMAVVEGRLQIRDYTTGTAISAPPQRSWPTTSILATPSGTPRAAATAVTAAATPPLRPALPSPLRPTPPPRAGTNSPSWTTTTANSRFDVPHQNRALKMGRQVRLSFQNKYKEGIYHAYG